LTTNLCKNNTSYFEGQQQPRYPITNRTLFSKLAKKLRHKQQFAHTGDLEKWMEISLEVGTASLSSHWIRTPPRPCKPPAGANRLETNFKTW
jgi:hypothetical protein